MNKRKKLVAFFVACAMTMGCSAITAGAATTINDCDYVAGYGVAIGDAAVDTCDTPDGVLPVDTADEPVKADTGDEPDQIETSDVPLETTDSPFLTIDNVTQMFEKGDLNCDKRVNTIDVIAALRIIAGIGNTPVDYYIAADMNNDGVISALEIFDLQRYLAGLTKNINSIVVENVTWITYNGQLYGYVDENTPINGLKIVDGYCCIFGEDGQLLTGEVNWDGKIYYILDNGVLLNGWQYSDEGKMFYKNGQFATSWADIYGKKYYFDNEGKALIGWQKIDGKEYHFNADASMSSGWTEIDGFTYYFDNNGSFSVGLTKINGGSYYFDAEGHLQTGWLTIDGSTYYFQQNGKAALGWTDIGENLYYFDTETSFVTGFNKIDGKSYYFNDDGTCYSGWQIVEENKYYFTLDGAVVGEYTIDDEVYYFDTDGVLRTGWVSNGFETYYRDDHGINLTGWQLIDNTQYYFDNSGDMVTGFCTIDDNLYYFDNSGVMATGWVEIKSNTYYFLDNGAAADGFVEIDGKKYYFEKGVYAVGWKTVDNTMYYFDNAGVLAVGMYTINNTQYCFDNNGVLKTGWVTVDNCKYYFLSDGRGAEGFTTIDGKTYYFEKGKMAVNTTIGLYTIDANGECTKITTITGPTAKYKADEIISSIGKDAYTLYAYVVNHIYYSFVNVPSVYSNAQTADWASIAAFGMNRGYGACYHFAAYLDVLFQRAGYKSRIVVGTGFYTSLHCWNQIYVNGTWVNYDAVSKIYGASNAYLASLGFTFNQYVNYTY